MSTVTALKNKVKPQEASNPGICSIDLHYLGGGSDKVYHAAIRQSRDDLYTVQFAYGRRGSSLTFGAKTVVPVPLHHATLIYDKLVSEKIGKGYRESPGISGDIFGPPVPAGPVLQPLPSVGEGRVRGRTPSPQEQSGVLPQLCNECTEDEVERYIKDPAWGAQEKLDGKRKLIGGSDQVQGINKKGQVVPILPEISRAVTAIGHPVLLDGEEIGNTLHAFGLLEMNGRDLRGLSYFNAYQELAALLERHPSPSLSLVELAVTTMQKRALYKKLRVENKEGIIFKRLSAPYSPGRPASGGDHVKFKFWSDISVIVLSRNSKRSVQVGVLHHPDGIPVAIGNVSVPTNYELPEPGDIVDVRYLYANRGGCLYQPQYRGIRDDVYRTDCLETRIKYKGGK